MIEVYAIEGASLRLVSETDRPSGAALD